MPNQSRSLLKDHNYVIKVIDVAKVPEEIGMEALQEIETMGTLESPYIVGYYDSFIEDQKINIVIEYCPLGDLNSYIEKQKVAAKPFVENIVWKIFIHICLGIQYLHSKDIVHRDLKSLNIFMCRENVAKVGDLGCAKHMPEPKPDHGPEDPTRTSNPPQDMPLAPGMQKSDDNPFELLDGNAEDMLLTAGDLLLEHDQGAGLEQAGMNRKSSSQEESKQEQPKKEEEKEQRVGTPYYLAPELWRNEPCTKKSDIWALGVILYEMCCFQYPFPATEIEELENKVLNEKMHKISVNVNALFQDLITKMLRKDSKKRPCIEEIIYSDTFQQKAQQN